jgi:hypothetical protein
VPVVDHKGHLASTLAAWKVARADVIELNPNDTMKRSALNTLGGYYLVTGDLEKAVDHFQGFCRQPVTTYFPFFYLAATLKLLGWNEEAENTFAFEGIEAFAAGEMAINLHAIDSYWRAQ